MDPFDIAFVKAAVAAVFCAATGLTAYWIRLRYGRRRIPPELERHLEALTDEFTLLRSELEGRIGQVEERIDFAERRLVQGPVRPPTPPHPLPTPV